MLHAKMFPEGSSMTAWWNIAAATGTAPSGGVLPSQRPSAYHSDTLSPSRSISQTRPSAT